MTQSESYPKVCQGCMRSARSSCTRICKRCLESFCPEYASKIDQQFCMYCMHDVILKDEIITKDVITQSHSGKKTFRRVMKARRLLFEGQDWMFAQARAVDLSMDELETTIEYHRHILSMMLDEREVRRIKQNKQDLKKLFVHIPSKNGSEDKTLNAIGIKSQTVITTTKTKTKITASPSSDPAMVLKPIVAMLKAKGLNEAQIKAAIVAMAGKKG